MSQREYSIATVRVQLVFNYKFGRPNQLHYFYPHSLKSGAI